MRRGSFDSRVVKRKLSAPPRDRYHEDVSRSLCATSSHGAILQRLSSSSRVLERDGRTAQTLAHRFGSSIGSDPSRNMGSDPVRPPLTLREPSLDGRDLAHTRPRDRGAPSISSLQGLAARVSVSDLCHAYHHVVPHFAIDRPRGSDFCALHNARTRLVQASLGLRTRIRQASAPRQTRADSGRVGPRKSRSFWVVCASTSSIRPHRGFGTPPAKGSQRRSPTNRFGGSHEKAHHVRRCHRAPGLMGCTTTVGTEEDVTETEQAW